MNDFNASFDSVMAIYILLIILGFILVSTISYFRNKYKTINLFKNNFGLAPTRTSYNIEDISGFYELSKEYEDNPQYIDDITWNDLDMNDIYKKINLCKSSLGEEYLYKELHNTNVDKKVFNSRRKLINLFKENKELTSKIMFEYLKVGKLHDSTISDFYYINNETSFGNKYLYYILAIMPILSLLFAIFISYIGFFITLFSLIINSVVYIKKQAILSNISSSSKYFVKVIGAYGKLLKLNNPIISEYLNDYSKNYKSFSRYRYMSSALPSDTMTLADSIIAMFNIFFLSGIIVNISLGKNKRIYNDDFKRIVMGIAELELAISIANYELTLPYICKGEIAEEEIIDFENIYHPLVEDSVPNTLDLEKNIVITGSNASGKSTFIKAIGINLLFAQCTGTICANSFTYKPIYIISSMAIRDDVLEGNSYFMKEILSLKRILDRIENTYSICLIDEILRGTNTIERISASATILNKIADNNSFKLIATHDIELSEILQDKYTNYHFAEVKTNGELEFDYKVKKGAVITRNAINLLEKVGYDKDIIEEANRKANDYIKTKQWI